MSNINLIPWREELRKRQDKAYITWLAIVALVACFFGFGLYVFVQNLIENQNSRNEFLTVKIKELDVKIEKINSLKNDIENMKRRMETIKNLQESRNQVVHLLNDLPTLVSSGIYLDKVTLGNFKVDVQGATEAHLRVVSMIRAIEASTWLTNPIIKDIVAEGSKGNSNSVVAAAAKQFGLNLNDFNMSFSVPGTVEAKKSNESKRGRR